MCLKPRILDRLVSSGILPITADLLKKYSKKNCVSTMRFLDRVLLRCSVIRKYYVKSSSQFFFVIIFPRIFPVS